MTIRTVDYFNNASTGVLKDNTAGDIGADDVRDVVHSSMLEVVAQSVTTADITGVAGNHYQCTIAGLTANRNLTLPTASAAGEKVRVSITDGDADYELIIKGAATVTINGGSAATEWSRLFIAGESVLFESTSTTNWNVVSDGRIPCMAVMYRTAVQTFSDATDTEITGYNTTDTNIGNCGNATTGRVTARRRGIWHSTFSTRFLTATGGYIVDQSFIISMLKKNGATDVYRVDNYELNGKAAAPIVTVSCSYVLDEADYVSAFVYVNQASSSVNLKAGDAAWNMPFLTCVEQIGG